jgi:outer membrane protein TolC
VKILLCLVCLLFQQNAAALADGDTLHLTLDDCIELALARSPAVQMAKLDSSAALGQWRSTRAKSYPQLSLSGETPNLSEAVDYRVVYDRATDSDEFRRISSGDQRWYGQLELDQALPWGAELSVSSGLYRNIWYDDRISAGEDTSDYSLRRRISLTQPLLAGNPVGRELEVGRINWQRALIDHDLQLRQIKYDAKRLFFGLVSSTWALDISRQDLEQVRKAEELARRKLNAGLIPEVELLQIQVDLAQREGDFRQAEGAVEAAADRLKTSLGITINTSIVLQWEPERGDLSGRAEFDTTGERLELRVERMNLRRLELETRALKWSARVQAALELYYDLETRHSEIDLLDRPVNRNFGLTLHFSFPIFGFGATSGKVAQAQANLARARINFQSRDAQLLAELREALRSVDQAVERIVIAEAALELSQKSYNITAERFESGQVDSRDLLDAQLDLTRTRNVLLNARIDYELALANLELISPR